MADLKPKNVTDAAKKAEPELDLGIDDEADPAPQVEALSDMIELRRTFFWNGVRYRAGTHKAPAGMRMKDLPTGAKWNGVEKKKK